MGRAASIGRRNVSNALQREAKNLECVTKGGGQKLLDMSLGRAKDFRLELEFLRVREQNLYLF